MNAPAKAKKEWTPPFCSNQAPEVDCPDCGKCSVYVREQETYYEGSVEAFCRSCHARLEVQVSIEVVFSDPESTGCSWPKSKRSAGAL